MKFTKIKQIAKGWSSYVWLVQTESGKELVLKEVREKSPRKDLAEREGKMLLLANRVGVGPKVEEVNFEENYVIMELVKGKKLLDWILSEEFEKNIAKEEVWEFLKKLYKQLLSLDSINLSHNQLQVGKNILVVEQIGKNLEREFIPVIIDFEKASIKENNRTKNIGQIEAFLFYNPHSIVAQKFRAKFEVAL